MTSKPKVRLTPRKDNIELRAQNSEAQEDEAKELNLLGHPENCKCCCVCTNKHPNRIGDSFVFNCRSCGVFLPGTKRKVLRDEKKQKMPCDVQVADCLRTAYQ